MSGEYRKKREPYAAELKEYQYTLRQQVFRPPNGDMVVAAGADAQLKDWQALEPAILEGFRFRAEETDQPINPHLFPNLVTRTIWSAAEKDDSDIYEWPVDYSDIHPHRVLLRKILPTDAQDMHFNKFVYKISLLNIMSNPASRKKPFHVFMQLFPEYFNDGVQLLEVGCSVRHILNAFELQFQPSDSRISRPDKRGRLRSDKAATIAYNGLLARHTKIGKSLGIDEWNWELDTDIRDWARTNTLTPKEILAPPRMVRYMGETALMNSIEEYSLLDSVDDTDSKWPNLKFGWLDISIPGDVDRFLADNPERYDAIFIPTVMQQQSDEKRKIIFEQIEKFKKSIDSLLILQDFAWPNPENPAELIFADDIYEREWMYHTLFWDPNNPEAGWQIAFIHRTGRADDTVVGSGSLVIDGKPVSVKDRLEQHTPQQGGAS